MLATTVGHLPVSELCLGTMYFGTTVDTATSFDLLDAFVAAGGTFVDTANCYSFWVDGGTGDESEQLLGEWMRSRSNRSEIVLATKVGCRPRFPGAPFPAESEGLHPDTIVTAVDASLRRLGTDHIDLLYAHRDDRDYVAVQLRHSFVRPADGADLGVQLPLDDGHRRVARERGVRLVGYSPLVQGA